MNTKSTSDEDEKLSQLDRANIRGAYYNLYAYPDVNTKTHLSISLLWGFFNIFYMVFIMSYPKVLTSGDNTQYDLEIPFLFYLIFFIHFIDGIIGNLFILYQSVYDEFLNENFNEESQYHFDKMVYEIMYTSRRIFYIEKYYHYLKKYLESEKQEKINGTLLKFLNNFSKSNGAEFIGNLKDLPIYSPQYIIFSHLKIIFSHHYIITSENFHLECFSYIYSFNYVDGKNFFVILTRNNLNLLNSPEIKKLNQHLVFNKTEDMLVSLSDLIDNLNNEIKEFINSQMSLAYPKYNASITFILMKKYIYEMNNLKDISIDNLFKELKTIGNTNRVFKLHIYIFLNTKINKLISLQHIKTEINDNPTNLDPNNTALQFYLIIAQKIILKVFNSKIDQEKIIEMIIDLNLRSKTPIKAKDTIKKIIEYAINNTSLKLIFNTIEYIICIPKIKIKDASITDENKKLDQMESLTLDTQTLESIKTLVKNTKSLESLIIELIQKFYNETESTKTVSSTQSNDSTPKKNESTEKKEFNEIFDDFYDCISTNLDILKKGEVEKEEKFSKLIKKFMNGQTNHESANDKFIESIKYWKIEEDEIKATPEIKKFVKSFLYESYTKELHIILTKIFNWASSNIITIDDTKKKLNDKMKETKIVDKLTQIINGRLNGEAEINEFSKKNSKGENVKNELFFNELKTNLQKFNDGTVKFLKNFLCICENYSYDFFILGEKKFKAKYEKEIIDKLSPEYDVNVLKFFNISSTSQIFDVLLKIFKVILDEKRKESLVRNYKPIVLEIILILLEKSNLDIIFLFEVIIFEVLYNNNLERVNEKLFEKIYGKITYWRNICIIMISLYNAIKLNIENKKILPDMRHILNSFFTKIVIEDVKKIIANSAEINFNAYAKKFYAKNKIMGTRSLYMDELYRWIFAKIYEGSIKKIRLVHSEEEDLKQETENFNFDPETIRPELDTELMFGPNKPKEYNIFFFFSMTLLFKSRFLIDFTYCLIYMYLIYQWKIIHTYFKGFIVDLGIQPRLVNCGIILLFGILISVVYISIDCFISNILSTLMVIDIIKIKNPLKMNQKEKNVEEICKDETIKPCV